MERWEYVAGVGGGVAVFLLWQGYNIWPIVVVLGLVALLVASGSWRPGRMAFAVLGDGDDQQKRLRFEDIGGQEVAKRELRETLDFVVDTERITELGIRPLKGILLTGPPGTGKTLLAKAAATYTNAAFVAASGSEFVEMYVGVGAKRVRQLFKQARELARKNNQQSAVVFIDEIEVLAAKRGQQNGNVEYDQALNELLVQVDGISLDDEVRCLLIGATNRVDILDPAILRPGRFDRQVRVDLPDRSGRHSILTVHTRNKPLGDTVCLEQIAADTCGFSGAHLESLVNEAAILALREGCSAISMDHLRSAVDKVILGERLDRVPSKAEFYRVAVHESGHALVSELTRPGSVAVVTVTPRNNALGYVRQTQEDDSYLYTKEQLEQKIAVALGGALAEEIVFGNRSTGAASDFQQAADVARQIVLSGMSQLGLVSADDLPQEQLHEAISQLLEEVRAQTAELLGKQQVMLNKLAETLMSVESLPGEQLRHLLQVA